MALFLVLFDAIEHGIWLRMVERPEVQRDYSASPRQRVVECNFA